MTNEELLKEYSSLPAEAKVKIEQFIASVRDQFEAKSSEPKKELRPLTEEPFFGMWADREDMADSVEWVRKTRREHWSPDRRSRR